MPERRTPKGPPPRGPPQEPTTLIAPRPELTDELGDGDGDGDSGIVWGNGDDRLPKPSREISLIEARESGRASSFGEGAVLEDAPQKISTEVLRLAFSNPEDTGGDESAEPPDVRKWKMGGTQITDHRSQTEEVGEDEFQEVVEDNGDARRPKRQAAFQLPPTDHEPAGGPGGSGTRVERGAPSAGRATSLDVDALRTTLEEAEKLMRTVKSQVAGLDLEARGLNAQVAAALHRLNEALAMLKK